MKIESTGDKNFSNDLDIELLKKRKQVFWNTIACSNKNGLCGENYLIT